MTPSQLSSRPLQASCVPCWHCAWSTCTPAGTITLAVIEVLKAGGGGTATAVCTPTLGVLITTPVWPLTKQPPSRYANASVIVGRAMRWRVITRGFLCDRGARALAEGESYALPARFINPAAALGRKIAAVFNASSRT